jgi:hypothetical protein
MKQRTFILILVCLQIFVFMRMVPWAGASKFYRQNGWSAVLSEIQGKVMYRISINDEFIQASNGISLPVLSQLQTGDDSKARLDLSTGTIIRVSPSSLLTLKSNETFSGDSLSTTLGLDIGKIWIVLNGGTLDVIVPSGVAAVRGSYMSVQVSKYLDPAGNEKIKVLVTCFEGDCHLRNSAGSVSLMAGQAAEYEYDTLTGSLSAPTIRKMTGDEIAMWLIFVKETAAILDSAYATMTALPSLIITPDSQNGTVPSLVSVETGSNAFNSEFSLGTVKVKISDPQSGKVTASLIRMEQFAVSNTQDDLSIISHGVYISMSGSGPVQICFAYPPLNRTLEIVRWAPFNSIESSSGHWDKVAAGVFGLSICALVPEGVFALAG